LINDSKSRHSSGSRGGASALGLPTIQKNKQSIEKSAGQRKNNYTDIKSMMNSKEERSESNNTISIDFVRDKYK